MSLKNIVDMDPDELRDEALRLLDLIAMEFKTDPQATQCFALGIVHRVVEVADEHTRRQARSAEWFGT